MSGTPPRIQALLDHLKTQQGDAAVELFLKHLRGGTSANYLADWCERTGFKIGATTLKDYRRGLQ